MTFIKLIPKSERAEEMIKAHGNKWELLEKNERAFLARAMDDYQLVFNIEKEAGYEEYAEE